VLGTGVDIVYPARNQWLVEQIVESGAVLSEFPLSTGPRRSLFPKRNRLISGMSLGVLVVEAALQSGSLITARCALEQGREVYAIPGSIHGTASRGCHAMIRQGAKLVETATDILEELQGWMPRDGHSTPSSAAGSAVHVEISDSEQALLDFMAFDPATIDQLQQRSGWTAAETITALTTLELKGLVENRGGCYQQIALMTE
jgi:DNA processing protein